MNQTKCAWLVCVGATLLLFTTVGILSNAFTVFQPYIIDRGNMTESQGSMLITVRFLFNLLATMVVPFYFRRLSLRVGMVMALVPGMLSVLLYSAAADFLFCCVAAALAGVACGLGSMVPATMLMEKWFQAGHRGLPIGICAAGTGVASVVGSPALQGLMERYGMTAAMRCTAGFFVISGVVSYCLIRSAPQKTGVDTSEKKVEAQRETLRERGAGTKKAKRLLYPAAMLLAGLAGPALGHLTVYMTDERYDPTLIAWLLSAMGVTMIVGKCLLGELVDWMGGRRACMLVGSIAILGQTLECLVPSGSTLVTGAALLLAGTGMSLSTVGIPIWCEDLCEADPDILCTLQVLHTLGSVLLSPLPGILADWTGSYQPAYILFAVMSTAAILLMNIAYWLYYPKEHTADQ